MPERAIPLQASCTHATEHGRVAATILSTVALLSSVSIKVVDAARSIVVAVSSTIIGDGETRCVVRVNDWYVVATAGPPAPSAYRLDRGVLEVTPHTIQWHVAK